MRAVRHFTVMVWVGTLMGSVCLEMLGARGVHAQSAFSQIPMKPAPQLRDEGGKSIHASQTNQCTIKVEWQQGKLSVSAERAPLSRVLQQVSAQTGIEFLNSSDIHKQTSVHFSNVPLQEGLKILLAGMDYGTIGSPGDPSTMRIAIFEPDTREFTNEVTKTEPAFEPPAQTEKGQPETKDDSPPRIQAGDLDPATDMSVLSQALRDKDAEVKEAAIRALAERGGSDAVGLLRQVFQDSDSAAKLIVIENIGSTPDVLPLLQEASWDPDVSVREAALAVIHESTM